ncbi:glycoside hydrolase family 15 protein [Mucilaginibacter pallidiroseus]|uniref:Glycoside hydrolase family 15 protein n=1 Tax=Mucilaginibacter pallidiroseus TaxID=2599295 RepID=A0A563U3G7_9SPHI|nr:glycoside hydrolase family 15 protein [Mucilaginibacter pallidiroseus]TWR25891.1 glycoside hydrolase family 15 protein [Mucilaginibacter pallidiroseus]
MKQPSISSLAVISDRHTCAILDKEGTISWYCPGAFDSAALFSSLIDEAKAGFWEVSNQNLSFLKRKFADRSSVLITSFEAADKQFTLTDFMPLDKPYKGVCRQFNDVPPDFSWKIRLRADYGLQTAKFTQKNHNTIHLSDEGIWLHSAHELTIEGDVVKCFIPAGESSWAALINTDKMDEGEFNEALSSTLKSWKEIKGHVDYSGPYEAGVRNSLRALQQMVYEPTGGIIAAPTTGLPEVIGGKRNYDYRYVWMRDAALITSSLVGLDTDGKVEKAFMSFVSGAMIKNNQSHVSCFYGIDQTIRKDVRYLPLSGYEGSRPLMAGNTAADQFQLDAEASILLACGAIYAKTDERPAWDTVELIADYICKNWERKDNGIWEEEQIQHYTSSKGLAARALEVMAQYQDDKEIAERWLYNAGLIRDFIAANCITIYGAFAVHAGSEDVDISCALLASFGFVDANDKHLKATINAIEERYSDGNLYRRHLMEFDSANEGVFLAASCWMAHYYVLAKNPAKARLILSAVQDCANDLGYLSEEYDAKAGVMLGNFPQTFVHSSFICAVNELKNFNS